MTPVILSSGHDIDEMEAMRAPIVESSQALQRPGASSSASAT